MSMTKTKNNGLTNNSGFLSQIRKYGISKILLSWDMLVALLTFALLILSRKLGWGLLKPMDDDGLTYIVTVASAIFSVLITALAIILSFSSSNFVKFLREKDIFDKIIFIFWWASLAFL